METFTVETTIGEKIVDVSLFLRETIPFEFMRIALKRKKDALVRVNYVSLDSSECWGFVKFNYEGLIGSGELYFTGTNHHFLCIMLGLKHDDFTMNDSGLSVFNNLWLKPGDNVHLQNIPLLRDLLVIS